MGRGALPLLLVVFLLVAALLPAGGTAGAQDEVERRVFTYFFYWYEPRTDEPLDLQDVPASLSLHHPPHRPADWRSIAWYRGQLADMREAGIDVALAVYWGNGLYPETAWSGGGLESLRAALDELAAAGEPYPRIGLFFDTYVLRGAHLTDPERLAWFAEQVSAFYRRIPARHRATQDGRPIVWLYYSNFANSFEPATFETLDRMLEEDLGARPFWVAEQSWAHATSTSPEGERSFDPDTPMPFDAFYRWGAASAGRHVADGPITIISVGAGYDDTAVLGRGDERSHRPREGGCFYARNWRDAQALGAQWVAIETWNELYEGSAIAETAEWGRAYIDATATYAAAFKRGDFLPFPPNCPEQSPEDAPTFADASPAESRDPTVSNNPDELPPPGAIGLERADLAEAAPRSIDEPDSAIPADFVAPLSPQPCVEVHAPLTSRRHHPRRCE